MSQKKTIEDLRSFAKIVTAHVWQFMCACLLALLLCSHNGDSKMFVWTFAWTVGMTVALLNLHYIPRILAWLLEHRNRRLNKQTSNEQNDYLFPSVLHELCAYIEVCIIPHAYPTHIDKVKGYILLFNQCNILIDDVNRPALYTQTILLSDSNPLYKRFEISIEEYVKCWADNTEIVGIIKTKISTGVDRSGSFRALGRVGSSQAPGFHDFWKNTDPIFPKTRSRVLDQYFKTEQKSQC